ncbi:MAG: glucose-6-phosphate dehydrogenase [Desulfofustis sp.]|nr:glucose-6-phosphate dehydrogenase [Desulfofustis sp.]
MKLDPHMTIIFGATGDLAKRKLIPSFYRLLERGQVDDRTAILCLGRKPYSQSQYLERLELKSFIDQADEAILKRLTAMIKYRSFDLENGNAAQLESIVTEVREQTRCGDSTLFYLALPTSIFGTVAAIIEPLIDELGWKRVVFEKPFGSDLSSARKLNRQISAVLDEEQIYRVDHYLGKELVQNILFLRFANEIFSCGWNRDAIDSVQITVSESLGVEERAAYYNKSGAIRDMLQNHLLQLLCFTAMEPPKSGYGNAVRDEAVKVISALRPPAADDVVVGQYVSPLSAGDSIRSYRQENGVPLESTTETYVAVRAFVDTPRWFNTPFYLRTGKRLDRRYAEIKVIFKEQLLEGLATLDTPNIIIIRIQPDEGIAIAFNVRKPGEDHESETVLMDFCHHCHFGPNTPEAYEAILASVISGEPLLFTRWDWLQGSWSYIDRLREVTSSLVFYEAGSPGPEEADLLLEQDGRSWR